MVRPRKKFPVWLVETSDVNKFTGKIVKRRLKSHHDNWDRDKTHFFGDKLLMSFPLGTQKQRFQIWKGRLIQSDAPTFYDMYLVAMGKLHGGITKRVTRGRFNVLERSGFVMTREKMQEFLSAFNDKMDEELVNFEEDKPDVSDPSRESE